MSGIKAKKVLGYLVLPGVIPRARRLFSSGFGYIAFLMASIYAMVRLLPPTHPYLVPANIGKFGIRHVIAAAANNLVISRKNIDQFIIFGALLSAIVILGLQFLLLAYSYVIQPAFALSMFDTPAPEKDIAFILMDKVFGVPDLFCNFAGTCSEEQANLRTPFQVALHSLFQFYSTGLLIIGVLIFLYFILVVVLETAVTGSPFGQRFQNGWVPIRLVVALGLLVPINYGLNSGQYITLYAAKFGSGFATNGWLRFNNTLSSTMGGKSNPTGEKENLMALPVPPDITPLVNAMALVHACAYATWHADPYTTVDSPLPPDPGFYIRPYLVKSPIPGLGNQTPYLEITETTTYTDALDFYDNADILIRFGERDTTLYSNQKGAVKPTCGDIRVRIGDLKHKGEGATVGGSDMMQQYYFDLIKEMWFAATAKSKKLMQLSDRYIAVAMPPLHSQATTGTDPGRLIQCDETIDNMGCDWDLLPECGDTAIPLDPACATESPTAEAKQEVVNDFDTELYMTVYDAWNKFNTETVDFDIEQEVLDRGWAGAGIWYNRINQINGAFANSVIDIPAMVSYPSVMEEVRKYRREHDSDPTGYNSFEPNLSNGTAVPISEVNGKEKAKALNDYFQFWAADGTNMARSDKVITGNVFEDIINMLFGTNALFAMRGENANLHPLAQLTTLGKGLVDASVRNIAGSTFLAAIGGPASLTSKLFGTAADAVGGLMNSAAFLGLTAGFLLFYILPFLPFMYFFFCVASWIKSIFEAMVGVPLWALAHLRLDGEGLPGDSASSGYFLIFEIFLRPILTVSALIGATIIFAAQVRVLNFTWALVVDNLTGFSGAADPALSVYTYQIQRSVIDQFFFTLIYTIVVYMMATASFKLIDSIPDNLLRWMGAGVSAYSDIDKTDPFQDLNRYALQGGVTVGRDATNAVRGLGQGLGELTKAKLSELSGPGQGQ